MQTKALGPRWPRAHDVVAMLAIAGAVVTEHARPARDLDLIDAGSRACQVDRLHDGGTQIATREPSSRRTQQ